jgi:hypothetical protein
MISGTYVTFRYYPKGFVLNNVLLFKGKTFDVDALKTNILRFGSKSLRNLPKMKKAEM